MTPAHIDGCTVIILRRRGRGFHVVEQGMLSHDGDSLSLVGTETERPFSEAELNSLKLVVEGNRIPECQGFTFFMLGDDI